MVRFTIVLAVVIAASSGREAAACSCRSLSASDKLRSADVAFRGRVLAIDPPRTCPARAPAAPAAGEHACIYGLVTDPIGCVSPGSVIVEPAPGRPPGRHADHANDGAAVARAVVDASGGFAVCALAPGSYFVYARGAAAEDSAVIASGEVVELAARAAVRVELATVRRIPIERALLRIVEPYKSADPPSDRWVSYGTDGAMCGFGAMWIGQTYDVFATQRSDGLAVGLCGGTTRLSVDEPGIRGRRGCGGCSGGGGRGGVGVLVVVIALRARRARGSRRRRSVRGAARSP
jgi:hypothetical protein